MKDFRPINVVGGLFKLLTQVLANKLKEVMGEVVSDFQCAFIKGRQILDAVPIASEVIDSKLKSNTLRLILKMDIFFDEYFFFLREKGCNTRTSQDGY